MADETKEEGKPAKPDSKVYTDKIKAYREQVEDTWKKQRENLDKLYSREDRADSADREYSIFWANIEVLKEASYSRPPVPVVAPRFKQKNVLATNASEVLERTLITTFEQSDLDSCMIEVRNDFLRYARGTAWARLATRRDGGICVEFDPICAGDFAHDPKRKWKEVTWVARRFWLTREKGRKRFDEYLKQYGKSFDNVPLKKKDENAVMPDPNDEAPIWELWDLEKNKVVWFSEDFDCLLDEQDPWLDLSQFWPCPKPAYGTLKPGCLKPVPDIRQYKDQIEEINEYTERIASLSDSLRLKGVYPSGSGEISEAIEAAFKNMDDRAILIPVSNFAALGGVSPKDAVIWFPVIDALKLIQGLVELRRVVIEDVYQITGIADIVRGQSDPNETLGAQQLKSQWGSLRIQGRQKELARFARDMTRIAGEIIAENFDNDTVYQMAQVELPTMQEKQQAAMALEEAKATQEPPPEGIEQVMEKPSFEEVMDFLRNDRARGFIIEIETDSTIQPDEDAEKARRTEFVQAVGGLFQQAAPTVQMMPQAAPFFGEVLKFAAQGFRAGRPLESAIDDFTESLSQMAQQSMQPPPPDPAAEAEAEKAKLELRATEAKTEATVVKSEADMAKTRLGMAAAEQQHENTMEQMAAKAAMPQQQGRAQ